VRSWRTRDREPLHRDEPRPGTRTARTGPAV
jgi:hypothetical protein